MTIFVYLRGMFRHFLTKKRSKLAPLALLSFAGLLGCASIGSPGGGLYDETPPVLVRSEPAEAATSVNRQKITMRFNENIKLALKADASTPYKTVKKVMSELQDMDESHYYMITQLKQEGDE